MQAKLLQETPTYKVFFQIMNLFISYLIIQKWSAQAGWVSPFP